MSDGQIHVLFKVVAGNATGQHELAIHRGGVDKMHIVKLEKLNNNIAKEALQTDDDF